MKNIDILNELDGLTRKSKNLIKILKIEGNKMAQLSADYSSALAEAMEEIVKDIPPSLVKNIAHKKPNVARLINDKTVAEVNYKACQEELYNLRSEIRVLEAKLMVNRNE